MTKSWPLITSQKWPSIIHWNAQNIKMPGWWPKSIFWLKLKNFVKNYE